MDKNTIIGFVLIGLVIVGFSIYNQPNAEEVSKIQQYNDSIAAVQAAKKEKKVQEVSETTFTAHIDSTSAFYAQSQGVEKTIVLENEMVAISINNKGGRVSQVLLKSYKDQQKDRLVLFNEQESMFSFSLDGKQENIHSAAMYFQPVSVTKNSATMRLTTQQGGYIDVVYELQPNTYLLNMNIKAVGLSNFFPSSTNTIKFDWRQKARHLEKGFNFEQRYTSLTYKPIDKSSKSLSETNDEDITPETAVDWIAYKNQYFSAVLMTDKELEKVNLHSKIAAENSGYMKEYTSSFYAHFDPSGKESTQLQFYFGPNHFKTLLATNEVSLKKNADLEELVYLGWPIIRWINRWFTINLFDWLSGWGFNMGIVILLMTIIVKLVVLPTTWKSFISSAKMRALRPHINKINEKYPNQEDMMKKQQETMMLYKEYGVSPMGGCLPMLIQTPVLMAVFFFLPNAIELRQQSFLWADDLSAYDDLIHWSTSIPLLGNHLSIFCILFSVTTVISQMITMKQQDTGANPQMAAMKWMMYLMPVMFFFIFNDYASGLSYYYFVSSLVTILTSWIMNRVTDEKKLLAQLEANKKDLSKQKQSGLTGTLIALQKKQEEMEKMRKNKKQ